MSTQTILLLELVVNIVLLLVIAAMYFHIRRSSKVSHPAITKEDIEELKNLIDTSDRVSTKFIHSLSEGRDMLTSLASALDEKEARLRALLKRTESILSQVHDKSTAEDPHVDEKYRDAMKMIQCGIAEEEICRNLGLSSGEIELIRKMKNINLRDS